MKGKIKTQTINLVGRGFSNEQPYERDQRVSRLEGCSCCKGVLQQRLQVFDSEERALGAQTRRGIGTTIMRKIVLIVLFLMGIIYLVLPGPQSVGDIPQLSESLKSKEPGDTTQVPNISAYFSNQRREDVTNFYHEKFSYLSFLGIKIPAISLNHPPEEAYTYIRDQQASTYLEQYTYPLRDSLFVNGFEPFDINGKSYKRGATSIFIEGNYYDSKTNIRYYGSSVFMRVFIYIGIWLSFIFLWKLSKELLVNKNI